MNVKVGFDVSSSDTATDAAASPRRKKNSTRESILPISKLACFSASTRSRRTLLARRGQSAVSVAKERRPFIIKVPLDATQIGTARDPACS